jgi:hypothetical protein
MRQVFSIIKVHQIQIFMRKCGILNVRKNKNCSVLNFSGAEKTLICDFSDSHLSTTATKSKKQSFKRKLQKLQI